MMSFGNLFGNLTTQQIVFIAIAVIVFYNMFSGQNSFEDFAATSLLTANKPLVPTVQNASPGLLPSISQQGLVAANQPLKPSVVTVPSVVPTVAPTYYQYTTVDAKGKVSVEVSNTPPSGVPHTITSMNPNMGWETKPDGKIALQYLKPHNNSQVFQFDGSQIKTPNGKCVDVPNSNFSDGNQLQIYECNGTGAQQWKYGAGQYVNTKSGKCIDLSGSITAPNTPIQLWSCNQTPAKQSIDVVGGIKKGLFLSFCVFGVLASGITLAEAPMIVGVPVVIFFFCSFSVFVQYFPEYN